MRAAAHLTPWIRVLSRLCGRTEDFAALVEELDAVAAVLGKGDLRNFLCSASVHLAQREKALRASLAAAGASDLARRFLVLFLRKGRMADLELLVSGLREAADKRGGVLRGTVESAVPLSDQQQQRLSAIVAGHTKMKTAFRYRVNPAVLGGLRCRFGLAKLDLSLAGKLEKAHKELLQTD